MSMSVQLSVTLTGKDFSELKKSALTFLEMENLSTKQTTGPAPAKTALAKAATTKKAAPVETEDDDTGLDLPDDVEDGSDFDLGADEEIEAPKSKKAAAPKVTDKEVNAAAKAHAGTHGRAATLAILKKQFKVQSILELKPDQYASVIKALK